MKTLKSARTTIIVKGNLLRVPTVLKIYRFGDVVVRRSLSDAQVPTFSGGRRKGTPISDAKSFSNCSRSKMTVQLLLLANSEAILRDGWFWTGTFAENVTDYTRAVEAWSRFVRVLRRFSPQVTYICVPEVQEGRLARYGVAVWHFHAVIWNMGQMTPRRFGDAWCNVNGNTHNRDQAQRVRDGDRLASYIRKYVTKTSMEHIPVGRKTYFAGGPALVRPEVEAWSAVEDCPVIPEDATISLDYTTQTDFAGEVRFTQYRL